MRQTELLTELCNRDERFEELKNNGSKEHIIDNFSSNNIQPIWLDKEKFKQGKKFAKKYLFCLNFAHLSGLTLLVYVKSILTALLSTGNSRNVSLIFGRYFRTLMHIKSWYEGDVWDVNDPAHKSIKQVVQMHKMTTQKLSFNKKEKIDQIIISQYDMVVTQFAFIGLVVLYHDKFGIPCSTYELESLIHFWKGIGHLLGIKDNYNLCFSEDILEIKSLCKSILEKEIKPSIINSPVQVANEMSKGIINSLRTFLHLLTWESLIKYLFKIIDINKDVYLNTFSTFCYFSLWLTFNYTAHLALLRMIFNAALRLGLILTNFRKKSIEKYLEKKYTIVLKETLNEIN